MPTYEFACDPCRKLYKADLSINDPRPTQCPTCLQDLRQIIGAPMLNTKRYTSPTAEKYDMSVSEELVRERELQKVYETIWIPPEAKHDPFDHDH